MAFFDADEPVDNSKLSQIELLVDKKSEVYTKKEILYYEKGNVILGVAGVLKEKKDGSITGKIIAMAAEDTDDNPHWDVSNFKYDAAKLEDQLRNGKLEKVSETLFKGNDIIWGSHKDNENGVGDKLYGFDGDDEIDGWRGNDFLYGGKGKDELIGNIGDDVLNGGPGKDLLKGGSGLDTFVFDQKLKAKNVDTIKNFDRKNDSFELDHKIFSEFDKGKLNSDQFTIGKKADGEDPQLVYKQNKGALLYDADGNESGDALKFANVPKQLDLTHDLFFVT